MNEIGLYALLEPQSVAAFLETAWPNRPTVTHGLSKSIEAVMKLPMFQSLDGMLDMWPGLIQAHLPDVSDESSAVDVYAKDARKLFANKMGLLFNNVQTISPLLEASLSKISSELGLPKSTYARCMVYATPHGKGTAAHFDQNINFVVQLHGTKTWWITPNEHVENPTRRFTIGQPLDPELGSYLESELPTAMPEPQQKIVLNPGSMLFVPRGYWHRTEAEGEALALNFTFSQPTWIDLFTTALRSRLSLSPDWRELADGVNSPTQEIREIAQEKFDSLLTDLIDDLPNWRAEDIISATEGN